MQAMLLTALTVGFLGGVHCLGMCGGVVSAMTLQPLRRAETRPRLSDQLAYNLGRIGTYTFAGALAGGLGGAAVASASLLPAQLILFVLANGLLILLGLHMAGVGSAVLALEGAGAKLWRLVHPVINTVNAAGAKLSTSSTLGGRFAAGMAWGWTPCGLVYSMLALALVSGSAIRGSAVMLAFGLGTLPNLLAAAWILARFGSWLRRRTTRVAAGMLIAAFGIVGLVRVPGLADRLREGLVCLGLQSG